MIILNYAVTHNSVSEIFKKGLSFRRPFFYAFKLEIINLTSTYMLFKKNNCLFEFRL